MKPSICVWLNSYDKWRNLPIRKYTRAYDGDQESTNVVKILVPVPDSYFVVLHSPQRHEIQTDPEAKMPFNVHYVDVERSIVVFGTDVFVVRGKMYQTTNGTVYTSKSFATSYCETIVSMEEVGEMSTYVKSACLVNPYNAVYSRDGHPYPLDVTVDQCKTDDSIVSKKMTVTVKDGSWNFDGKPIEWRSTTGSSRPVVASELRKHYTVNSKKKQSVVKVFSILANTPVHFFLTIQVEFVKPVVTIVTTTTYTRTTTRLARCSRIWCRRHEQRTGDRRQRDFF